MDGGALLMFADLGHPGTQLSGQHTWKTSGKNEEVTVC